MRTPQVPCRPLLLSLALALAPAAGALEGDSQSCPEAPYPLAGEALAPMEIARDGEEVPIVEVRLEGLHHLDADELWEVLGGEPEVPIDPDDAARLVSRLLRTGLFAEARPTLVLEGEGAVLVIALQEFPRVARIEITGLTELRPEDVLDEVLEQLPDPLDRGRDADDVLAAVARHVPSIVADLLDERGCEWRQPRPEWVAGYEQGRLRPGIAWGGLSRSLERVLRSIHERGYLLASLEGELSPSGVLRLRIDEGRLQDLEVRGLEPHVAAEVRRLIGLQRGQLFLLGELTRGVERAQSEFPFVRTRAAERKGRPVPQVTQERQSDGTWVFQTRQVLRPQEKREGKVDLGFGRISWDLLGPEAEDELPSVLERRRPGPRYVTVDGGHVTLDFRALRSSFEVDGLELLRHTPVTGFAPGLAAQGRLFDRGGRAHLTVEGGLNLNTASPTDPLDWRVGAKVQLPALAVAELGGQAYALTDSEDDWRVTPLDAYLSSALVGKPNREYFRREGAAAFLTAHLGERLTLGAEYRRDAYRSMASLEPATSLFNRDRAPWRNPAIDEGTMGSVIGRIEWSTEPASLDEVGVPRRSPRLPLVGRDWSSRQQEGIHSLNTVEAAGPALGGDFRFVKVVSDTSFHLRTGADGGLRLRVRGAGGVDLPLQKQEALGGWGSLRGYSFKELRGELSWLVSGEYQVGPFAGFADLGSVRQGGSWVEPKLGIGAAFHMGPYLQLAAAWRTDDRARLAPDFKLVFGRTF